MGITVGDERVKDSELQWRMIQPILCEAGCVYVQNWNVELKRIISYGHKMWQRIEFGRLAVGQVNCQM